MAHGVHLTPEEIQLFVKIGASISHCPQSNTNLLSGMCDVRKLLEAGVKVGLGTDVSGGEDPSILSAMRAALTTSIHISFKEENYTILDYRDVFYMATLGGAEGKFLS